MKIRVLVGILLLAAAPVFAQTNVTGEWDVTINSPQGANTIHVTFKQDGEKLSGILKGQAGQLPVENGSVVADALKFSFTVPWKCRRWPRNCSRHWWTIRRWC